MVTTSRRMWRSRDLAQAAPVPGQLGPQRRAPGRVEGQPEGAQVGADAAQGHPALVDPLHLGGPPLGAVGWRWRPTGPTAVGRPAGAVQGVDRAAARSGASTSSSSMSFSRKVRAAWASTRWRTMPAVGIGPGRRRTRHRPDRQALTPGGIPGPSSTPVRSPCPRPPAHRLGGRVRLSPSVGLADRCRRAPVADLVTGRLLCGPCTPSPSSDGALEWREHPDPVPGPGELLVSVAAAGINAADLMQRRRPLPGPARGPGRHPRAGVRRRGGGRGRRHRPRHRVGDRVMAITGGRRPGQLVVVPETIALPVPDGVGWDQAGGFPEAFCTAYDALFTQARLGAGDRVLISGAAGGVGTAAVQLAHAAGRPRGGLGPFRGPATRRGRPRGRRGDRARRGGRPRSLRRLPRAGGRGQRGRRRSR